METTLKELFEKYSKGELTLSEVKPQLSNIAWPEKKTEAGETWYEGNQDNTVAGVQATLETRRDRRKFEEFLAIL